MNTAGRSFDDSVPMKCGLSLKQLFSPKSYLDGDVSAKKPIRHPWHNSGSLPRIEMICIFPFQERQVGLVQR